MGAVFRAWDERLKRTVAIKHILPEVDDPLLRERFRREAQAVASLNHSAIVHIYDIVEHTEGDWIVMELVEGQRLDQLLRRGPIELNLVLRLAREIARGLVEAHAKGIIHRDLKAENVMVTPMGRAKILDFGLAKFFREVREPDVSTTQGAVLGTARVMSPEQAMGLGVDHRSDLFSFGTLVYEMLTGRSPFKAEAVVETLKRVCTQQQTPVPQLRDEVPEALCDLIDHLLEKDPELRPRSAREVVGRLVRISEASAPESFVSHAADSEVREARGAAFEAPAGAAPAGAAPAGAAPAGAAPAGDHVDGDHVDGAGSGPSFRQTLEAWTEAPEERLGSAHRPAPSERHDSTTVPHRPLAAPGRHSSVEDGDAAAVEPIPPPLTEAARQMAEDPVAGAPADAEPHRAPAPGGSSGSPSLSVSRTFALEATEPHYLRYRQLGERRQVTVLSCDLLGEVDGTFSVPDPEVLYEVMPEFRAIATESIDGFEGHLGKILGHRLWAYFGYPQAHEDDAERAVRSALDLAARVRQLGSPSAGRPRRGSSSPSASLPLLALRAGIHTGPAVVTPAHPSEDEIALGSTLEQTAGIHELAEPHGVVVSDETRRLIDGSFTTETLGPSRPRGFDKTHTAHRIVAIRDARSRLEKSGATVALVGRKPELSLLIDLWRQTRGGDGQAVFMSGDAGIGKSRLVQALRERLREPVPQWWLAGASPFTRNSPLHPVAEMVRGLLEGDPSLPLPDRLAATLEDAGLSRPDTVPLFAALFADPPGERYPSPGPDPALRRSRTLEALSTLFLAKAERHPAVMVVEDLQWADPSTLELLDLLLDRIPASRLLLVLSYRPDFEFPWEPRRGLTRFQLAPLVEREAALLVKRVAAQQILAGDRVLSPEQVLPAEVRRRIVDRTDGIPLFVEELTKSLLESGMGSSQEACEDTPSAPLLIPATLRDSLAERLDRLGSAKTVAQRAAVIGREFSVELLATCAPLGKQALGRELDRLARSELVHRDPSSPSRYVFKHALVQEVAYESLLKKQRRRVHLDVARSLASRTGSGAPPPEVVARHYTRARRPREAAECWLEAGRRALERSANAEAIEHLRKGLRVLGALPPDGNRDWLELGLECALLPALTAVEGSGAPEVGELTARVRDLVRKIAESRPARAAEARKLVQEALKEAD